MARILKGTVVRDEIALKLKQRIEGLSTIPTLAVIQVGENAESAAYINQKKKFAEMIGAGFSHIKLSESVSEQEIISTIKALNADSKTHGVLVQMPIPSTLNKTAIVEAIDPVKDVDGLTSINTKALWDNQPGLVPATAKGTLSLLRYYHIPVEGKRVTVIGRSALVGRPLAMLLMNHHATVTVCHSKTLDLKESTRSADIIIVAAGVPGLISKEHVSKGQTIIDVGINVSKQKLEDEIEGRKLVGDVDFKAVEPIVEAISPVPGGVGPMTVASLFENVVEAAIGVRN